MFICKLVCLPHGWCIYLCHAAGEDYNDVHGRVGCGSRVKFYRWRVCVSHAAGQDACESVAIKIECWHMSVLSKWYLINFNFTQEKSFFLFSSEFVPKLCPFPDT